MKLKIYSHIYKCILDVKSITFLEGDDMIVNPDHREFFEPHRNHKEA
jgi:hypothetical protein